MPLFFPQVPTGSVVDFASNSIPNGWLLCDGSAISRTTHASLFNAIGTTYGVGDGSTTFNLPDCRGRSSIGLGTNPAVESLTDSDGLAVASRTPRHTHGPGTLGGTTGVNSAAGPATTILGSKAENPHTHPFTVTTGVTDAGFTPYIVFNKIIKE